MKSQSRESFTWLEYFGTGSFILFSIAGPFIFLLFLYLLLLTNYYWIPLLYIVWFIYDFDISHTGARSSKLVRNLRVWKYICSYISLKLVKTTDLNPDRNYLLVITPHGVLSLGAVLAFGSNIVGVDELFPKVAFHYVIQSVLFWFPIIRDVASHNGIVSSSEKSISCQLSSTNGCHATCLVAGGATELLYSCPGSYKTLIKRRKGFARLAIKHGTPLVPVIAFGEVDLFDRMDQINNRFLRLFINFIHKIWGFYPVIPTGKFPGFPHKRPVTIVVGRPMEVKQISEPTNEQIEETKEKFIKCLVELFEKEKHKYVADPNNTFLEFL